MTEQPKERVEIMMPIVVTLPASPEPPYYSVIDESMTLDAEAIEVLLEKFKPSLKVYSIESEAVRKILRTGLETLQDGKEKVSPEFYFR